MRAWVRRETGGHRARAVWTRHIFSAAVGEDLNGGFCRGSLCGAVYLGRYGWLPESAEAGIQGERRECARCERIAQKAGH